MNTLKKRLIDSTVPAAQRLVLALQQKYEYENLEKFEGDFDLVCILLEEANDELKPIYEERARRQEA